RGRHNAPRPINSQRRLTMKPLRLITAAIILCAGLAGSGLAQQIEKHGWKLVFVTWLDEETATEKTDKDYGRPSIAFFVKDYPYKVGQEFPKLLSVNLLEPLTVDSKDVGPHIQMSLDEFDCSRRLGRTIKRFWTDGTEDDQKKNLILRLPWDDVLPGTPYEAMFKYACRPRASTKK